ncbi:MAG: phosphatidylserine decarboxylase, partial [Exiguobacterium chiriqhucha]
EWTLEGEHAGKGDEVGYFSFGSTVILCFEKGRVTIDPAKIGPVRLGEVIGTMQNG